MKKSRLMTMLLALMVSMASFAQEFTGILGTVIDENGEPVIGATVIEKAKPQNATITNIDGQFAMKVAEGTTLVVSYVGYQSQEVKAKSQMTVTLKEDAQMLNDVVVVGYGVQKKSVVTAAISKVNGDDLNLMKPSRIEDALKGKVSGVQITQSSGQPNSDSKVRIRGIGSVNSSEPLYIVDGMPVGGGINYLNPFVNRTFHNSISYGNSDIEPEKKHNIALKYNSFSPKFMVSAGLNYRYGEGGIESYRKFGPDPENPAVNVIQTTYGNIVDSHSFGFNAFFNWNPVKDTRIYANAELDYDHFNSKVLGQENHGWCPDFVIGAQQTLPYDIRLSANVFVNGRSYNLQGWRSGFNGAALSVSRNFFKEKLGVTLQGFSNFSMKDLKIEVYTNGDGVEVNQKVYIPLKSLSLQLTYNFGKGNVQVKKTQRSITNDDVIDAQKGSATAAGGSGMDSPKNM